MEMSILFMERELILSIGLIAFMEPSDRCPEIRQRLERDILDVILNGRDGYAWAERERGVLT